MEVNYYDCDGIGLKESIILLKVNMMVQRVYSNMWQMTRDVFQLSMVLGGVASLIILIPALLNPLDTWVETLTVICIPLLFTLPVLWIGVYFGWYRNHSKIRQKMRSFMTSVDEVTGIKPTSPVSYLFYYKETEFHILFNEKPGSLSIAKGKIIVYLFYTSIKERTVHEIFEELEAFVVGKQAAHYLGLTPRALLGRFNGNQHFTPKLASECLDTMLYSARRFKLQPVSCIDRGAK